MARKLVVIADILDIPSLKELLQRDIQQERIEAERIAKEVEEQDRIAGKELCLYLDNLKGDILGQFEILKNNKSRKNLF